MNGRLIVIEGLDGSGKATQAARLADALTGQGRDVKKISFPDYASDSSALIKMYLTRRIRPTCLGHYRSAVGQPSLFLHHPVSRI